MKPEIFWRNIDIKTDDECWEWKLSRTPQGYGRLRCWGKSTYSHIVAYKLSHDDWTISLCVCHKCNNRGCCNPAHLYLGTHKQNMEDKHARYKSGELHRVKKTICKHGHLLTDDNLYCFVRNGYMIRQCKQCKKNNTRESYLKSLTLLKKAL